MEDSRKDTHAAVDDVVVDAREEWQDIEKGVNVFLTREELEVGLLVHVAPWHAPPNHGVLAAGSVYIRLWEETRG